LNGLYKGLELGTTRHSEHSDCVLDCLCYATAAGPKGNAGRSSYREGLRSRIDRNLSHAEPKDFGSPHPARDYHTSVAQSVTNFFKRILGSKKKVELTRRQMELQKETKAIEKLNQDLDDTAWRINNLLDEITGIKKDGDK